MRVIGTVNDNLEQQTQTIYRERFEGVSPDNLPFDWRIVTLGEVATISNKSFNPLKEAERLLEHYSIPAFDEARFPVFEPSTSIKSNKFIIDASCFMISKLNPTTKRVWKPYCITENAVCSTEFIVYKAKDQAMQGNFGTDRDHYMKSLMRPDLLILDDLGAERNTSFGKERVFDVVDKRLLTGKPMIVTTNIPLSVMKQAADLDDRRIYDRIVEVCVPIMFDGDSFRKSTAADNLKTAARLLG